MLQALECVVVGVSILISDPLLFLPQGLSTPESKREPDRDLVRHLLELRFSIFAAVEIEINSKFIQDISK